MQGADISQLLESAGEVEKEIQYNLPAIAQRKGYDEHSHILTLVL